MMRLFLLAHMDVGALRAPTSSASAFSRAMCATIVAAGGWNLSASAASGYARARVASNASTRRPSQSASDRSR